MTNDSKAVGNTNHYIAAHGGLLENRGRVAKPIVHCPTIAYAQELFEAEIVGGDDSAAAMSEDHHCIVEGEGGGDGIRHRIHP